MLGGTLRNLDLDVHRTDSRGDTSAICFLPAEVTFHLCGTLQVLFVTYCLFNRFCCMWNCFMQQVQIA